jgi:hypothetical protein
MDGFWVIPVMFVGSAFVWGFYLYIRSRPASHANPDVVLDKPPEQQPDDPAEEQRDWTGRPCGSYLDWLFGQREK